MKTGYFVVYEGSRGEVKALCYALGEGIAVFDCYETARRAALCLSTRTYAVHELTDEGPSRWVSAADQVEKVEKKERDIKIMKQRISDLERKLRNISDELRCLRGR